MRMYSRITDRMRQMAALLAVLAVTATALQAQNGQTAQNVDSNSDLGVLWRRCGQRALSREIGAPTDTIMHAQLPPSALVSSSSHRSVFLLIAPSSSPSRAVAAVSALTFRISPGSDID
jgi:hypothetical protein